jgi:hypothetical protein
VGENVRYNGFFGFCSSSFWAMLSSFVYETHHYYRQNNLSFSSQLLRLQPNFVTKQPKITLVSHFISALWSPYPNFFVFEFFFKKQRYCQLDEKYLSMILK